MSIMENVKLEYEIYKYTSYSSTYFPEHIRDDQPDNQSSRWSTDSNTQQAQFLILQLPRPAIVREITFGKYERPHVCNLKKFKIFGGTEDSCKILLLEGGLKNDSTSEKFELKHHTSSGEFLPVRYIQIIPLFSWGTGFNFSIWYVELRGTDDPVLVNSVLRSYNIEREAEIIRLCLKYFRQQGYDRAFDALQSQTNIQLEHSAMHELYHSLVVQGNYKTAEEQVTKLVNEGYVDEWIENQPCNVEWRKISTQDVSPRPGKRGGHQLILDVKKRLMYLYGGWNGTEDLSDMWTFDLHTNEWNLLHENSELIGGPTPRACHKMVIDTNTSQIFMLGRYIETRSRSLDKLRSDFYLFDTETKTWLLICDNTAAVGGPDLIFDHQMCIDSDRRVIYVFGGRILSNDDTNETDQNYSGLYAYHISDNVWTLLRIDVAQAGLETRTIKSRITHSMVFHEKKQKLYIFGGQRDKQYLTDFVVYDTVDDAVTVSEHHHATDATRNIPQPGLTPRATLDADKDEIYVLTSLSKEKERREMKLNALWMFCLKKERWSCIYRSDENEASKQTQSPCPRYAHQLVYDPIEKVHYLFGGNPGMPAQTQERLDDFWSLHLCKTTTRDTVLRQCLYLIRTQQYEVLTRRNPIHGLEYLQTELHQVINRNDPEQLRQFHKLATLLFKHDEPPTTPTITVKKSNSMESMEEEDSSTGISSCSEDLYTYNIEQLTHRTNKLAADEQLCNRYMLYNRLLEFLPEKLCQPKTNLTDFILI